MLNIITIAWNRVYLEELEKTIPKECTWWISVSDENTRNISGFYLPQNTKLIRTRNDWYSRVSSVFSHLENIEGYFCFVDNDTLFHEGMKNAYNTVKKNMLIGKQAYCNEKIRLNQNIPICGHIDMGNVLCNNNVLKSVQYEYKEGISDYILWNKCFNYLGGDIELSDKVISYYNYQRNQIDEQDIYK